MRRAVVDIGTNSVKLLVADVEGETVLPLMEKSEQTRLGQGLFEGRKLQSSAISRTVQAVQRFAEEARSFGPASIQVLATSAARDATNQHQFLEAIRQASGLETRIISGDQEADWVFLGVTTDPRFQSGPLMILDVGGGSSEFIAGSGRKQWFRNSLQLGTVRLLERIAISDPPAMAEWKWLKDTIGSFLKQELAGTLQHTLTRREKPIPLVGTGGTATILARIELGLETFVREKIESVTITLDRLEEIRAQLWSLPLAERRRIPGLPPNRADVILAGVAIYHALMNLFELPALQISTRGLRFAALLGAETANPAGAGNELSASSHASSNLSNLS
jgi:exopolyphosphatase / guanosine-5'-triphosphate,3'-diphosphate pyrophosphatase